MSDLAENLPETEDKSENEQIDELDRFGFITNLEGYTTFHQAIELSPTVLRQRKELETSRERKWVKLIRNWDTSYSQGQRIKKIKRRIRKGIPDSVRGLIWYRVSGAIEMKKKYPSLPELRAIPLSPKVEDDIEKDLDRTFPSHQYFRDGSSGQAALRDVLRMYAAIDPEVGYCQGMGFVVGVLLIYMSPEEAFYVFAAMMMKEAFPLRGFYLPSMVEIQKQLYLLDSLMLLHFPHIVCPSSPARPPSPMSLKWNSLLDHGLGIDRPILPTNRSASSTSTSSSSPPTVEGLVLAGRKEAPGSSKIYRGGGGLGSELVVRGRWSAVFATQWIMTLFSRLFGFDLVTRVFDVLLFEGDGKFLLRTCMALLVSAHRDYLAAHGGDGSEEDEEGEGLTGPMGLGFEPGSATLSSLQTLPERTDGEAIAKLAWEMPIRRKSIQSFAKEFQVNYATEQAQLEKDRKARSERHEREEARRKQLEREDKERDQQELLTEQQNQEEEVEKEEEKQLQQDDLSSPSHSSSSSESEQSENDLNPTSEPSPLP